MKMRVFMSVAMMALIVLAGGCSQVICAPGEAAAVTAQVQIIVTDVAAVDANAALAANRTVFDTWRSLATSNIFALFSGKKMLASPAYTWISTDAAYAEVLSSKSLTPAQAELALAYEAQSAVDLQAVITSQTIAQTYGTPQKLANGLRMRPNREKALAMPPWLTNLIGRLPASAQAGVTAWADNYLPELLIIGEQQVAAAIQALLNGDPYAAKLAVLNAMTPDGVLADYSGSLQAEIVAVNQNAVTVAEERQAVMGVLTLGISVIFSVFGL